MLKSLSIVYGGLTSLRNGLYSRGMAKSHSVAVPVVSVGNLTVGGTGKTPIIDCLLSWSVANGLRPGVVSRGYKGRFQGVQRVVPGSGTYFGDEPTMIATRHPQVPVYVGKNRVEVAENLLSACSVDLILADDAFQHRSLQRDLDIVVIDVLEPIENYRILPEGVARESLEALRRADVVIYNKVNLVDDKKSYKLLREYLAPYLQKALGVEGRYVVSCLQQAGSAEICEDWSGQALLLVSGIGRPGSFPSVLSERHPFKLLKHLSYNDHHDYSAADVKDILQQSTDLGADKIVCTEKDSVKLKRFAELADKIWVAPLEVNLGDGAGQVYEKINSLVSS